MAFRYFYGKEADQYSFIRIPKLLLTGKDFSSLSIMAKMLYGLLLDRMGMASKNKWLDRENRVYVIYPIAEIQQDMCISRKKAMEILSELEEKGLVEKQIRGSGLPNLLYIKQFTAARSEVPEIEPLKSRRKEEHMEQKVSFNYFYGSQADQYSFYRIPKALFKNDYFRGLSSDAKILYGLMLDRMSLSIKNQWFDDENRAYIYFSIEDIMELLNCGRNKAVKSLQELDSENGIGLIEKKRQGFGKTNIIYVKSFMMADEEKTAEDIPSDQETEPQKFTIQTYEGEESDQEVYKTNFKKSQKQTSRSPENKLQEVCKTNSIYNNLSYNKENDTESVLKGRYSCFH